MSDTSCDTEVTGCSSTSRVSMEVRYGSEFSEESAEVRQAEVNMEAGYATEPGPSGVTAEQENQPSSSQARSIHHSHMEDENDAVPSTGLFVQNMEGEEDLIHAVRANNCQMIQQLVQSGLDMNDVCRWEGPPCMVRVERDGFRKQLQMMGYAALHVAAIHANLQTIKLLLSLGADVNIRDKNERTALQLSVAVNRPAVAQFFIETGSEVNTRSASGRSPLMEAVANIKLNMTQMLLAAGANPDLPDIKGTTPLLSVINVMAGLGSDQPAGQAIVQSLIDAGCQVDKTNPAGATALMLAAGLKNTPVIHMLVAAGADVNKGDKAGHTPLDMSTDGQRNLTAVKALMQYGAATHVPDNKGQTPLSKSLKFGSVALLRLLLSSDAVPHTYDILTAPRIVQLRQYLPEFDAWLHEELYQPRPLRRLCRENLRNLLSPHNLPKVGQLGLPRTLNNYILGETD
ncbi:ankyrin homolog [Littorina saxatilis]|uniref:SOCS box domain-containing protein n=1 Tax=Littorina saxatilis TaxID=31220 RepID=A0AAN9ATU2_9CAEN